MATCKICKSNKVDWRQSKAGKWYLVNSDNSFHSSTCKAPVIKKPEPVKRPEIMGPFLPGNKIEILSFVGSEDPNVPTGKTSGFKSVNDAIWYARRNYESEDQLWRQVTRLRVNDQIMKIDETDPDLAPYSIVRIQYPSFYLPEVPYSFEVALQRRAAAQGSVGLAKLAHNANYNGHYNHLSWNDYRGYYIGEYTWAGRNVWYRGTNFQQALEVAKREYKLQGLGASLVVTPQNANDLAICEADQDLQSTKDDNRTWWTWKHTEANHCVDYMGGVNYRRFDILCKSETQEQFQALLEDDREAQKEYNLKRGAQLSKQFEDALGYL